MARERQTVVDQEPWGSIPPLPFQSLGNFVYPILPVSFHLVYMPGQVKDPTQGNGKNLLWTHSGFNLKKTLEVLLDSTRTCR